MGAQCKYYEKRPGIMFARLAQEKLDRYDFHGERS